MNSRPAQVNTVVNTAAFRRRAMKPNGISSAEASSVNQSQAAAGACTLASAGARRQPTQPCSRADRSTNGTMDMNGRGSREAPLQRRSGNRHVGLGWSDSR